MRRMIVAIAATFAVLSCTDQNAYRVADEQQRASVVTAVQDYYGFRNRLTAGLEITDFWRAYPELSHEHDGARGINLDLMLWTWSKDPQLVRLDYQTDLVSCEPIRVFVRANEALAYVHGMESYTHRMGTPRTLGEFRTVLSMKLTNDAWTVVRTDEQMLGERPPTDPPVR